MSDSCPCKSPCPLSHALTFVGGKWKIPIICALDRGGTLRYNAIRQKLPGITNTMLAKSLRELEADGLLQRTQYPEIPPKVEYKLNPKACELIPILKQLSKWGSSLKAD